MANLINKDSKVIIIDDFEVIRSFVRKELQKLQYENVDEAADGSEALDLIRKATSENAPYDLIICDWTMPNMDGYELLTVCKEDETLKDIPFVMLTVISEREKVIQAISSGVINYIVKPIEPGTLEQKIEVINAQIAKDN